MNDCIFWEVRLINLINEKITHKVFGVGNIVEQEEAIITVEFDDDMRKFVYPDAFGQFIELKDEEAAKQMEEIISKLEVKREKKLRKQQVKEQQLRGRLNRANIHESSQIVFWLDEEEKETVFDDWEVFAGTIQSGKNEGNPNRPARLRPNSAALLTVRKDDQEETERKIIGLYMVHETLSGSEIDDGMVFAHDDFKLKLTEEESEQLLFWNYYINKNYPHRTTWNSGKYRYFDNIWTAQILKDIIELRSDEEEIKQAKLFLEYFCNLNALDIDDIPEAEGALKQ